MRFKTISITKALPAFLILALAASAHAQTSSQNGFSRHADQQNTAPPSRYRFVTTSKEDPAAQLSRHDAAHSVQIDPATCLVPATDPSTSPLRLNPLVDNSVFNAPTPQDAPIVTVAAANSFYENPASRALTVMGDVYVVESVAQLPDNQPVQMYDECSAGVCCDAAFVPPKKNFFGIDPEECCDEWDGFVACGGLKANPGHWGLPWLCGRDACERENGCGCQRGHHKCKHDCKKACAAACKECATAGGKKCGIKQRHALKRAGRCECSSCNTGE